VCVLCTLLFMMSIEALVKREKEKKESSLGSRVLEFIFLVHETQHTHDKNHKIRTRTHQIKPPHQRITSREDQTCD
jgi:hypothetical protein